MKNKEKMMAVAMQAALMLSSSSVMLASKSVLAADDNMEKCYGIVKAGMNDCATATASCASSATKDAQPDAFLFVPKGSCDKIVGGSLKALPVNKKTK